MAPTQTPQVDAERLRSRDWEWGDLEDHEKLWLRDHALLSKDEERQVAHLGVTFGRGSPDVRVSNDPNFIAEQQLQQSGLFDQMVEERAKELARQMLIADQQGRTNVMGGENTGRAGNAPVEVTGGSNPEPVGSGDMEEAPPYDQWQNDELRKELRARNLSASGPKDDLIKRLEEDDAQADEPD